MLLQNVVSSNSKFFLKSEWGLVSDDWPAVSFSSIRSVGACGEFTIPLAIL
jgi:hypothetical protein